METKDNVLQSLNKMMQARLGGWSIKRVLIMLFGLNLIVLQWIYVTPDNFMMVTGEIILFLGTLLGFNHGEKKVLANNNLLKESEESVINEKEVK